MKNHLVINIGSSSIKVSLFRKKESRLLLVSEGYLAWSEKTFRLFYSKKNKSKALKTARVSKKEMLSFIMKSLVNEEAFNNLESISHRIVHGGNFFSESTLITKKTLSSLKKLSSLAPLHNPLEIHCIEEIKKIWPKTKQFAHFDTAFFHDLPKITQTLPLPKTLCKKTIKRYGFHGLSHESNLIQLNEKEASSKQSKIILCHLGSGCSLAAVSSQNCIDTTMGFTPLDGLIMGTRPGSLDPGVLIYLLEEKKLPVKQLKEFLEKKSGLLGISNKTPNLNDLINSDDLNAKLAVEMFILSVAKNILSMMCSLGGCDHLVFTGGIGENLSTVRSMIIKKLSFIGFQISSKKKILTKSTLISTKSSMSKIWVFKCDENLFMAQKTSQLLS